MASPVLAAPVAPPRPAEPLPEFFPGELWLVERPAAAPLSAEERRLFAAADVVVYDSSLAPLVGAALPLGGYAEPAGARDGAAAQRCRHFAGDGWRVVRLVDAVRAVPSRAERLRRLGGGAEPRVLVDAGGRLVAAFPRSGIGAAPVASAVAANGLAG
jgi:hypothetical protein